MRVHITTPAPSHMLRQAFISDLFYHCHHDRYMAAMDSPGVDAVAELTGDAEQFVAEFQGALGIRLEAAELVADFLARADN